MTTLAQELRELRRLKDIAEEQGRAKKEADAAFKQHQARCLQRMEAEELRSARTDEYLYSTVEKVKGQIEDRTPYVRDALENDPAIAEFLDECVDPIDVEKFFDAITSTSTVRYKEDGHVINQQARSHLDDGAPLPPGLTFRPEPYISMVKS